MAPLDPDTQKSRGYFVLSRSKATGTPPVQMLIRLNESQENFRSLSEQLRSIESSKSLHALLMLLKSLFLNGMSSVSLNAATSPVLSFAECGIDLTGPGLAEEFSKELEDLKSSVRSLPLFAFLKENVYSFDSDDSAVLFAIFLLAIPDSMLSPLTSSVLTSFQQFRAASLLDPLLDAQVIKISDQLATLHHFCHCSTKHRLSSPIPEAISD
jgi:hypothetical protein